MVAPVMRCSTHDHMPGITAVEGASARGLVAAVPALPVSPYSSAPPTPSVDAWDVTLGCPVVAVCKPRGDSKPICSPLNELPYGLSARFTAGKLGLPVSPPGTRTGGFGMHSEIERCQVDVTAEIDWKMLRDKAIEVSCQRLCAVFGVPGGGGGAGRRQPDRGRLQCGECLIWPRSLCRVRCGLRPTFRRRRTADRAVLCGRRGQPVDAVRAVQAGAARARRAGSADRPPGGSATRWPSCCPTRSDPTIWPGVRPRRNTVTQFTFDAPTVIRTKRDGGVLPDDAASTG